MDERLQILEMVREGKITSEQATALLDALAPPPQGPVRAAPRPRREAPADRSVLKKDLRKLVEARIHGVTPEYIAEMTELGYTDLTLEELQNFKMFGVTPDLVRGLEAAGYSHLGHKELCELAMHGVTPDFIESMRSMGIVDLGGDDLGAGEPETATAEVSAATQER